MITSSSYSKKQYPFGMVMPGRSYSSSSYRYGFNGMEKDDEIKGSGNSYTSLHRGYDPRLGKWLSLDPEMLSYPNVSPYTFVNNNPILLIDPDGKEWVNAHTENVKKLEAKLSNNPNDRKIKVDLRREKRLEERTNEYINSIYINDRALYNYIDKLKVTGPNGKDINIKVYVNNDPIYSHAASKENAHTEKIKTHPDAPKILDYNGEKIKMFKSSTGNLTFNITIFNEDEWGDLHLANEVGDVMFMMEYQDESTEDKKGDAGMRWENYKEKPSSTYSDNVEKTYKARKKSGEGKKSENNPYPLKKE